MIVGETVYLGGTTIENRSFSGVNIGVVISAPNVTLYRCHFSNLITDGTNGTAVTVEGANARLIDCTVDGSDAASGAAYFLAPGSSNAEISGGYIRNHPQVGIGIGSTSYVDFPHPLAQTYGHYVHDVLIEFCGSAHGGDAGSGVAIVGNALRHRFVDVRSRYNKGAGFSVCGALKGDGVTPGTPMLTEVPTWITFDRCVADYNQEEAFRVLGANYVRLYRNEGYENSQKGQSLFKSARLQPIGIGSDGLAADLRGLEYGPDNHFYGGMPAAA